MIMASEAAWAQLVCTTDPFADPVPISSNRFTVGRAKSCDLSHSGNKLVSGHHCRIVKDRDNKVWLEDSSTNGTLVNLHHKVSKGERKELVHGDEIYVVYRKNELSNNVAYLYQNMAELEKEKLDATQEYSSDVDISIASAVSEEAKGLEPSTIITRKRTFIESPSISQASLESKESSAPALKKQKTECEETVASQNNKDKSIQPLKSAPPLLNKDVQECKEADTDDKLDEKDNKDEGDAGKVSKPEEEKKDGLEETLICIICQEILHDCISLQPCMHSFCAGCYSDWMERSNECPSCRMDVERINKNHLVNNLVEAYLLQHPDKKRPDEDISDLNKKNKISKDMLYPKKKRRYSDDDYSDENSESDNENSASSSPASGGTGFGLVTAHVFGTTPFIAIRPPKTVCRQCPEYKEPMKTSACTAYTSVVGTAIAAVGTAVITAIGHITGAGTTTAATSTTSAATTSTNTATESSTKSAEPGTSGTSTSSTTPVYPQYKCTANQMHVLCQCCLQPMPDRRNEATHTTLPPIQCRICYRNYCHMYWGCRKYDCHGCLAKFKDLNFGKKAFDNLILENPYESELFKNFLDEKGISVKDLMQKCLEKTVTGEYTSRDIAILSRGGSAADAPLCYACGLRNFRDLAYLYRKDIPQDQLTDAMKSRPDCYWGKNCRTQRNKPHHALRFNHICEQSRTSN